MTTETSGNPAKTPFYNLHQELGGKMVPFAGYAMPVQFKPGIIKEHLHTREQAGLFDVSHMGQLVLSGPNVVEELERLVPLDLEAMPINQQSYSVLTLEKGGILDDLIVTRWSEDTFFLVVNAACKKQDIAHLGTHLGDQSTLQELNDRALLALQGPAATRVMQELAPQANELVFMTGCRTELMGADLYVTRSGYTGEDGFELSIPNIAAESICRRLLEFPEVEPIGLGARDSLRLEAGLCLYGHDMDQHTSPIEAGLIFAISKSRRRDGAKEGGYLGAETVLAHHAQGVTQKRVGFMVEGRIPVREGAQIENLDGEAVGRVTSGGFAPSLGHPIALGYVVAELSKSATRLVADVRGKKIPVTVSKTPFVEQRYFRG